MLNVFHDRDALQTGPLRKSPDLEVLAGKMKQNVLDVSFFLDAYRRLIVHDAVPMC